MIKNGVCTMHLNEQYIRTAEKFSRTHKAEQTLLQNHTVIILKRIQKRIITQCFTFTYKPL